MANILDYLTNILKARYGREVRQSIHDAIHQCYEDGKAGSLDLEAREQILFERTRIDQLLGSFTGTVKKIMYPDYEGRTELFSTDADKTFVFDKDGYVRFSINNHSLEYVENENIVEAEIYINSEFVMSLIDTTTQSTIYSTSSGLFPVKAGDELAVYLNTINTTVRCYFFPVREDAAPDASDLEVVDARVGPDGTVYDSLGEAIRAQTAKIVQADWNQKDETASDYIKNKIGGYYGFVVPQEIFNNEELDFSEGGIASAYPIVTGSDRVTEDLKVSIIFDGSEYSGMYKQSPSRNFLYFGNYALRDETTWPDFPMEDTGEPFVVVSSNQEGAYAHIYVKELGKHTVDLKIYTPSLIKIPAEMVDLSKISADISKEITARKNAISQQSQQIDKLKNDLSEVYIEQQTETEEVYQAEGTLISENWDSTGTGGYYDATGKWTSNESYRWFRIDNKDVSYQLYTEGLTGVCFVHVFSGEPSENTFVAKYRSTDSDLPTESNPLTIQTGHIVVIQNTSSSAVRVVCKSTKTEKAPAEFLTKAFAPNVEKGEQNIAWFGDSISQLQLLPHRVAEYMGITVHDCSFAGAPLTYGAPAYQGTGFMSLASQIVSGDFTELENALSKQDSVSEDKRGNADRLKSLDLMTEALCSQLVSIRQTNSKH